MPEFIYRIMPGMGERMNVHPLLVHFPIGLLNSFVLLEFASLITGREDLYW